MKSSKNKKVTNYRRSSLSAYYQRKNSRRFIEIRRYIASGEYLSGGIVKAFVRKRVFTPLILFLTILDVGRESLSLKLERVFGKLGRKGMEAPSQQAFSKARSKMNELPFKNLFEHMVRFDYNGDDPEFRQARGMHGYYIFANDGSKISLPDVPEIRMQYFTTGAGATSPSGLASILVDVVNNLVIDAAWSDKNDERALAMGHIDAIPRIVGEDEKKVIVLFDRGYPSGELFGKIMSCGYSFLMRAKKEYCNTVKALPDEYSGPVEIPGGITLRCLRFTLESGNHETLLTNLDDGFSDDELKELYSLRWGAEESYLSIKARFQLENFTGKTDNSIRQDFWAIILADYIMSICEEEANVNIMEDRADKELIHNYVVNRNKFVHAIKEDLVHLMSLENPSKQELLFQGLRVKAERYVRILKKGRHTDRKKNKRKTEYSFNRKRNI